MMTDELDEEAGPRIIRLLAVVRGLEDEGQYNVAKLFRAAAIGEAFGASRNRPRMDAGLAEAMDDAIADLRDIGYDEELLSLMERGAASALAGEWTTLAETPRPFVCRDCGAVTVREEPANCPECGARSLGMLEVIPIYYLEPLAAEAVAPVLAAGLADVERSTAGMSAADAERGVWPPREILAHVLASEQFLVGRARRMLTEDEPLLVSVSPDEINAGVAQVEPTFAGLRAAFGAARRETLALAATLSPEQWQRRGYHPEWGWLTVVQQLSYLARHEAGHLSELSGG
jgi:DinB superfamily